MPGISPKLPLMISTEDGPYRLNKTVQAALAQDLKMIILTNPGERMMDPSFGAGVRTYIFENFSPSIYDDITSSIMRQVEAYLPQIVIDKITFNESEDQEISDLMDNNILSITITYSVPPISEQQSLTVSIT